MRIGLISDTHMPGAALELPPEVIHAFQGVDLILHAGDIYAASCLNALEAIAPVKAVEQSMVGNSIGAYWDGDPRIALKQVMEFNGYTVGLVHELSLRGLGNEPFPGVIARDFPREGALQEALVAFFGREMDVVVFGHTHDTLVEVHQGVLLVNPGSPTLPRQMRRLGTVGILELTEDGPQATIIDLAERERGG